MINRPDILHIAIEKAKSDMMYELEHSTIYLSEVPNQLVCEWNLEVLAESSQWHIDRLIKMHHIRQEEAEAIREEYRQRKKDFHDIAQKVLMRFNCAMMAGKIAEATIESIATDLLEAYKADIKVICMDDGAWKCHMWSPEHHRGMVFFSDASQIREDIERCAKQIRNWDVL